MVEEAPRSSEDPLVRIEEAKAQIRLARARAANGYQTLDELIPEDEIDRGLDAVNDIRAAEAALTDGFWIQALRRAGIDARQIVTIMGLKEEERFESIERARQAHEDQGPA